MAPLFEASADDGGIRLEEVSRTRIHFRGAERPCFAITAVEVVRADGLESFVCQRAADAKVLLKVMSSAAAELDDRNREGRLKTFASRPGRAAWSACRHCYAPSCGRVQNKTRPIQMPRTPPRRRLTHATRRARAGSLVTTTPEAPEATRTPVSLTLTAQRAVRSANAPPTHSVGPTGACSQRAACSGRSVIST
jgi:hypothetical protein